MAFRCLPPLCIRVALFLIAGSALEAQPFLENVLFENVGRVDELVEVDLDDDGDEDIVYTTTFDRSRISWLESDGEAPPSYTRRTIHDRSAGSRSLTIGDLDGDGDVDIASAFVQGGVDSTDVAWFENNGSSPPSFTRRVIDTAKGGRGTVIADFTGDGRLDVFVCRLSGDSHALYRNNGGSPLTFVTEEIGIGASSDHAKAADMDGDRDMDLVLVNSFQENVRWFENRGGSPVQFVEQFVDDEPAFRADAVELVDLDRDGDVDVITGGLFGEKRLVWYENNGRRPPLFSQRLIAETSVAYLSAGDIDDDGFVDISSIPNTNLSNPRVLETHRNVSGSTPSFETKLVIDSGPRLGNHLWKDVDNDGAIDVLALVRSTDGISWFRNRADLLPVYIERSLETFSRLRDAMDAARSGDTIVAVGTAFEPGFFAEEKEMFFRSLDELSLSSNIFLLEDTTLSLPYDKGLDLFSSLSIGGGRRAFIDTARAAVMGFGRILVRTGSLLHFRVPPGNDAVIRCGGEIELGANSTLILGRGAVLGPSVLPRTLEARSTGSVNDVSEVSAADIDGDGDLDLFGIDAARQEIFWEENSPDDFRPTFWNVRRTIVETAANARSIQAGDIDGDGDPDFAVAFEDDGRVAWFENDGEEVPGFTEHEISSSIGGASTVRLEDFNGDGTLEVLAGGDAGAIIALFFRRGDVWSAVLVGRAATAAGVRDAIPCDVNGDGELDVVAALGSRDQILWFQNDGTERFAPRDLSERVEGPSVLRAGDIDGDGDQDVAVACTGGEVLVFQNQGGAVPTFRRVRVSDRGNATPAVGLLDIDLDGDLDVLASLEAEGRWFESRTDPLLEFRARGEIAAEIVEFESFDFDGDKDDDVLAARGSTFSASYTNEPSEPGETYIASGATLAAFETLNGGTLENEQPLYLRGGSVTGFEFLNRGPLDGFGTIDFNRMTNEPDGTLTALADLQIVADLTNQGDLVAQNGMISIIGSLVNEGTITGVVSTPAGDGGPAGIAEAGLFVAGDFTAPGDSALLLTRPGERLILGASFDVAIDNTARFDLSQAELRLAGTGDEQTLEVMSRDIGPDIRALDSGAPGLYPIETLRIGPTATSVRLVDNHDNDGQEQDEHEAVYVRSLRVDAGASLVNADRRVYYESLEVLGEVSNPENLVQLAEIRPFLRGDTNGDRARDASDAVRVLLYLFAGGSPPGCLKAADFNDDGQVQIDDTVSLLGYLFQGGDRPAPPILTCGDDPTIDLLSCLEGSGCP